MGGWSHRLSLFCVPFQPGVPLAPAPLGAVGTAHPTAEGSPSGLQWVEGLGCARSARQPLARSVMF